MEHIRDMLYVKAVERKLRRLLTEDEMNGESFSARLPNGKHELFQVPYLEFPYDLLPNPEDYYQPEVDFSEAA